MYSSTFLLALGLAAQGAVATYGGGAGGWAGAKPFSCPGNTPTTCSGEQSGGFTWGGLQPGQQVSSFGGCGFSGVTCQDSGPGGKLHKRGGFQDKCVSGEIHGSQDSCPRMSAGQGSGSGQTFSPTSYQVSCSYDTQVDFTYEMEDGSTCKHTSPCMAAGNTVQNTQCGGAKHVTCSQNEGSKKQSGGSSCSMGIHSIGFQCGPASSITPPQSTLVSSKPATTPVSSKPMTTPVSSKPETTPVSSKPETTPVSSKPETTPVSSKPETTPVSSKPETTPVSSKPETTPMTSKPETTPVATSKPTVTPSSGSPPYQFNSTKPASTTPVASSSSFSTTVFQTTSIVYQTTEITVTSCAPTITNCPADLTKTPLVITSTISSFTTICPVTATMAKSDSSMASVPSATPVPETTPVATSKPADSSAPVSQPSASSVPLNCPDVVPSCINTLLSSVQTECSNNGDSACFCSVANHTMFIQNCVAAHGSDAAEIQTALSYIQGLCAPQIPQNPTIVTHQPNGMPQQPACPSGVPATTVTVQYTTTVPCSQASQDKTTTVTSVSQSVTVITAKSTVTIPQVQVTAPPAAPGATTSPAPALVPGPAPTQPAAAPTQPAAAMTTPVATSQAAASVPAYGNTPVSTAASTGGVVANTSSIKPPIATGAAGKMGVSVGAVAVAAAFLL